MQIDDAILTLSKYNQWRTGKIDKTMDEAGVVPAEITKAIDCVLLWYEVPDNYALDLIRRMLPRLQETGHYSAVCEDVERYLEGRNHERT